MIPKTATERQKAFRLSRLAAGLKEIRNLWAHPEDVPSIRDYAAQLHQKRQHPIISSSTSILKEPRK